MKFDVIVIGAGAAGLMAMHDLLEAGYNVCLLEASAAAGGRIATVAEAGFNQPVETGAEFVHGELPLTLSLLKKAGISYVPVAGRMVTVRQGNWHKNEEHDAHWDSFMQQLGKLKTDMPLAAFLQQHFQGDAYANLRKAVQGYSEGFDLGDITKASAMAAQREWSHEEEQQYRLPGGYGGLVNFLASECNKKQGVMHFNTVVAAIEYHDQAVTVRTTDNRLFQAGALLVTVSAGVLQAGMLQFLPVLDDRYTAAIQQLGFGSVIKVLLQFATPFWKKQGADIGFILSDAPIRTWWTQLPLENNLLTGWLGGPPALAASAETDASLLQLSLDSLAAIFQLPQQWLQQHLVHYRISNWHAHPYVKGGYSYNLQESVQAKKVLAHPVNGKIFFAGEALYNGQSQGTVEAALQSGREVAATMKSYIKQ